MPVMRTSSHVVEHGQAENEVGEQEFHKGALRRNATKLLGRHDLQPQRMRQHKPAQAGHETSEERIHGKRANEEHVGDLQARGQQQADGVDVNELDLSFAARG